MSAVVHFLKEFKTKSFTENVELAKNSMLSLQFHKNLNFLKNTIEIFAKKFPAEVTDETRKTMTGILFIKKK